LATALQFVNEVTVESPEESRAVKLLARFFFASFWMIVFTGAVRKWLFPGYSIFYLLQDVPIFFAYLVALRNGLFTRGILMLGLVLMSSAITLQALVQVIFSGLTPFVAMVGLHNYLFYLPMLLVFPLCLTVEYRRKFIWWNLMLSIPMCLLAIVQAQSPKAAFINRSSEGDAFGVSGAEVARVTGTFNFISFYVIWVAMAVALCMGEWLQPKERRVIKQQWLLIVCTFAVNLCHLIAASRSAIMLSALSIVGGLAGAILLRSGRAIAALSGVCVLLPVVSAATYLISPDEFNVVMLRFTGDYYVSEQKDRLVESGFGFLYQPRFSLLGAGVGMGVDAAHVGSADAYSFTYALAETDITRIVMELGTPLGLTYVLTRLMFGVGVIFLSIRMVRAGSMPHLLPMSFFLMGQVYLGDLTRNAAMSASQTMVGYSFILGAFYYPDTASLETASLEVGAGDSSTRSV